MHSSSWAQRGLPRRSFLRVAGSVAASASLVLAGCNPHNPDPTPANPTYKFSADDTGLLTYLYLLKQLQVALYQQALAAKATDLLAGELDVLNDLRDHEVVHLRSLGYALSSTTTVTSFPLLTFSFTGLTLSNRAGILGAAQTIEDLCLSAFNFVLPYINNSDTLAFVAKITSAEARHAATVRDLLAPATLAAPDDVLTSGSPLATATKPADVVAIIGPYISAATIDVSLLPTV